MACWFLIGVVGAAAFSSAGPIFADQVDPALESGSRRYISRSPRSFRPTTPSSSPRPISAALCSCGRRCAPAEVGDAVDAPCGMHHLLILLAWRSMWRIPAFVLWAVIWVGSVHLGYHYALDGIVPAAARRCGLEIDRTDGGCGAGASNRRIGRGVRAAGGGGEDHEVMRYAGRRTQGPGERAITKLTHS